MFAGCRFEALPFAPTSLLKEGCEAFLVSYYNGGGAPPVDDDKCLCLLSLLYA